MDSRRPRPERQRGDAAGAHRGHVGRQRRVSRAAVGQIPPLTMVTLRWLAVCAVLGRSCGATCAGASPVLLARKRFLALMALAGYTGFNVLFYLAGYWTSAVNITLLQGVDSRRWCWRRGAVFKGVARHPAASRGHRAVVPGGVGLIATRGDLPASRRAVVQSRRPDDARGLRALCAAIRWRCAGGRLCRRWCFSPAWRSRLSWNPCRFSRSRSPRAVLTGRPARAWRSCCSSRCAVAGLSQLFFMRAVELIGPGRAGIFTNLTPLFGAFLRLACSASRFISIMPAPWCWACPASPWRNGAKRKKV